MESFLFTCMLVVLVIRWIYLRNRLDAMENRLVRAGACLPRLAPARRRPTPRPAPMPPRRP